MNFETVLRIMNRYWMVSHFVDKRIEMKKEGEQLRRHSRKSCPSPA